MLSQFNEPRTFKEVIIRHSDKDLWEYAKALEILQQDTLNEGFLDSLKDKLSKGIKDKIDFIKEIATLVKINIKDLFVMFKDSKMYEIFKVFKFSIKKIVNVKLFGLFI